MLPPGTTTSDPASGGTHFVAEQASTAIEAARAGVRQWLTALGRPQAKPKDLQALTGLDYTLCWQLATLARSSGLAGVREVPGPVSVKRLITVSQRLGLTHDVIYRLEQGMEQFHAVASTLAGRRVDFDTMVLSLLAGNQIDLQLRRSAFRTDSQIWGIQVELFHQIGIFGQRPTQDTVSHLLYNAKHGLRRMRPNVTRTVSGNWIGTPAPAAPETTQSEASPTPRHNAPLDPQTFATTGAPLLPEFCSKPLPAFRSVDTADGWRFVEVDDTNLGVHSDIDLSFAIISDASEFEEGVQSENAIATGSVNATPTQEMVIDFAFPTGMFGEASPSFLIHPNRPGYSTLRAAASSQLLDLGVSLERLGTGPDSLFHPKLTRAPEIFNYLCSAAGWDPHSFEVHRLRVEYPVLHSVIKVYLDVT